MKHKLTENDRQILIEATQILDDHTYENAFLYICELEKEMSRVDEENKWLLAELDAANEELRFARRDAQGEDYE